ncbi:MAG TPA: response regulator [Candidatus Competibacteraceae bacterium]|nr:MAG: response regulator [Candidatus Competibacteraceae bacterium]HOB60601.1 response regulator [Candidatus Competibacteraceae bacterium]HQA24945.1 response regulator [Candidatus Competibacteraceae bacterium]HQD54972.1 response regulator [Candidatus Competibacteraceae bacterium]
MTDQLLIVDDDPGLRELLTDYLGRNGFQVDSVADGRGLWAVLEQHTPDLIILDLMLPGDDGLVLCRNLRARSQIPIIMLTAKGDDTDRIVGLEMGADDYLPKPFNPRELLARIKVVLRRGRSKADFGEARRFHFAGWSLDVDTRQLVAPDGVVVPLGASEYRLLRVFLDHPQRILNRDQLLDLTQGREAAPFDRSIDVQVSRLRRRLRDDPRESVIIKTIRNEGYLLATHVNPEY